MKQPELIDVIPVGNILGEGVLWDHRSGTVWWTDIEDSRLYHFHPKSKKLGFYITPERLASFAFTSDEAWLVAGFESGFAHYRPRSGEIKWIAKPEQNLSHTRFNDGRVDRQGRFWAGTMVEGDEAREKGALYRLDHDGMAHRQVSNIMISNSLCWSPDGTKMYFADSSLNSIDVFDFNLESGVPINRRHFAKMLENIYPDGSTVDREGYLWNAQWGGSRIIRYVADGTIDFQLDLPVSQPTCVAFGGSDLSLLFVTTAKTGLTEKQREDEPYAGHLLVYKTEATGLEEHQVYHMPTILKSE